jgi:hypothetical protein
MEIALDKLMDSFMGLSFLVGAVALPLTLFLKAVFPYLSKATKPRTSQFHDSANPFLVTKDTTGSLLSGVRLGLSLGVALIFFLAGGAAFFMVLDKILGGHGAGGGIGFLVIPVAMFLGAPWTFLIINKLGASLFLLGIAASVLLNCVILGVIWRLTENARNARRAADKRSP